MLADVCCNMSVTCYKKKACDYTPDSSVLNMICLESCLITCRWGHTPLQHAVSRRHGPAIEVLQKYDARLG